MPPKNRAWRKLHLAVDADTGDVVACDLGSNKARDAARVPGLLKQVAQPLASAAAECVITKPTESRSRWTNTIRTLGAWVGVSPIKVDE
jgi:hypothetical protein